MEPSRRPAARTPLAITAAILTAILAAGPASAQRTGAAGPFALELAGVSAGLLRGASGGHAVGEVVTESGSAHVIRKHIGAVRYADIVLEVGPGMEPGVYQWIGSSWEGKPNRTSGAILAAAYNLQVVGRTEFQNALLAETTLPAFDAASKEPAFLTLRLVPELVRHGKGGGSLPSTLAAKTQRAWLANSFRLEIPGLDCSRVRKIDAIQVRTEIATQSVGIERSGFPVPGSISVSDVVVTLPEASADTWQEWANRLLVEGNAGAEKDGDLVALGSDGQSELARIHLYGLGISSLRFQPTEPGSHVRNAVATLYCERASLEWKGGAGATMNVRMFGR